jgi:putative signal transducing protein
VQVVYRANNLIEAHLAKHALEGMDIPVFIFGESLLGGAGELPLFGVLRVCVPDPCVDEAMACLADLQLQEAHRDQAEEDPDALPAPG